MNQYINITWDEALTYKTEMKLIYEVNIIDGYFFVLMQL